MNVQDRHHPLQANCKHHITHYTTVEDKRRKKKRWQGDVLHQSGCFTFFTSAKHRPVSEPERVLLAIMLITTTNLTIHLFHPYFISFIPNEVRPFQVSFRHFAFIKEIPAENEDGK